MFSRMIISAAVYCLVSMAPANATLTKITVATAIKIAKAYAFGVNRDMEKQLDGETLDHALASPQFSDDGFEFLLQDASGDCGLTILIDRKGEVILEATDAKWSCT